MVVFAPYTELDDAYTRCLTSCEECLHRVAICEVDAYQFEVVVVGEHFCTAFLQGDVVVVVEVVEADDGVAAGQEFFGGVEAYEAGGACY